MPRPRALDAANLLSLSRVALAGVVWVRPQSALFLLVVVAVAAATDALDGWVGRRTHAGLSGTSNVGAWLDPLCDKAFVASAGAAIVVTYEVAPVVLALILLRDVSIVLLVVAFRVVAFRVIGGRALFHAHDYRARAFGKVTMAAQVVTLASVVVAPRVLLLLAVATAVLGVAAVVERVVLVVRDVRHAGTSRATSTGT